jgi:hypothetical protein
MFVEEHDLPVVRRVASGRGRRLTRDGLYGIALIGRISYKRKKGHETGSTCAMNGFDELANTLSQEVLAEMAENFFGARSRLDVLLEGFQALAAQLRGIQAQVRTRFSVLHHLLLRGREARAFYLAIGADPELAGFAEPSPALSVEGPAFALTLSGRYAKTVLAAYAEVRSEAHDFMQGRIYVDAHDRGRRRLTVHYSQVVALHAQVNETIRKVNENLKPSSVMQYVKTFNPEKESRERVAGVPSNGYSESMDSELRYQPVDFDSLGLRAMPELPEAGEAAPAVRAFCARVCRENEAEVRAVLAELEAAAALARQSGKKERK